MPITKSAAKRMRSDRKKTLRNQMMLNRLKTLFKNFTKFVAAQQVDQARKEATLIIRENDKAASKGIIPRERADRKKARVTSTLHKLVLAQSNKK